MPEFDTIDPLDWSTIEPHFAALLADPLQPSQVETWLARWSELYMLIMEEWSAVYRGMNEDTTDRAAAERFEQLSTSIRPRFEEANQKLREKILALEDYDPAPEHREFLRRLRMKAALFREANVALSADETVRAAAYMTISGAQTIVLDNVELTLPQAESRLLERDRAVRETAWRAIWNRRRQDEDTLTTLLLELLALRRQAAANAGYPNYLAYRWHQLNRLDYTPEQVRSLHHAIEAEIVPLFARLQERRRKQLGLATLRPWDTKADPNKLPPLHPFQTADELEAGIARIASRIDPLLGAQFERMRAGYLDLASRKGKALMGFCTLFPRSRMPYIFMNAIGTNEDVRTLLHEAGHAFHAFAYARYEPLLIYVDIPIEFAEVASQAMELLALPYLDAANGGFYTPDDAQRARVEQLEWVLKLLCETAADDAWHHWLYADAQPEVGPAELMAKWVELQKRFCPAEDWSGLTAERAILWQQLPHPFMMPLYIIEYTLAMLGALQIWSNAMRNQQAALAQYRSALSLGGTRSVPELYKAAGASLVFDRPQVAALAHVLAQQLELD